MGRFFSLMRREIPEEMNRVADVMAETEEILHSLAKSDFLHARQKKQAQDGVHLLSTARETLEAVAKELRPS